MNFAYENILKKAFAKIFKEDIGDLIIEVKEESHDGEYSVCHTLSLFNCAQLYGDLYYDVFVKNKYGYNLAGFSMYEMPSCCGMCVFTDLWVEDFDQHGFNRLSKDAKQSLYDKMVRFQKHLAKAMGYTYIAVTLRKSNTFGQNAYKSVKHKEVLNFKNKRTGNKLNCILLPVK